VVVVVEGEVAVVVAEAVGAVRLLVEVVAVSAVVEVEEAVAGCSLLVATLTPLVELEVIKGTLPPSSSPPEGLLGTCIVKTISESSVGKNVHIWAFNHFAGVRPDSNTVFCPSRSAA
jgi:hypothetical protein